MYGFNIGDIVDIDKQAVIDNAAALDCNYDSSFEVIRRLNIGENAYNLRDVASNEKIYIREDVEYNFIENELGIYKLRI